MKRIKGPTINADEQRMTPEELDPKNLNGRLYDAMSTLLDHFDDMNVREQVATIAAIARIQVAFIKIREDTYVPGSSGAAVKRYEKAFAANANRQRGKVAGSGATAALNDLSDDDGLEY